MTIAKVHIKIKVYNIASKKMHFFLTITTAFSLPNHIHRNLDGFRQTVYLFAAGCGVGGLAAAAALYLFTGGTDYLAGVEARINPVLS